MGGVRWIGLSESGFRLNEKAEFTRVLLTIDQLYQRLTQASAGQADIFVKGVDARLDVIKCCDWIVEMGPEGGAGGGRLLAEGTPEKVVAGPQTPTSGYLQELLDAAVS